MNNNNELPFHSRIETVRDLIENPIVKSTLWKNQSFWTQLCSGLDVVEDAELAMTAYLGAHGPESTGFLYLMVYGLLQAIFVQQDALLNICETINLPCTLKDYPALRPIRDIRNASIGHPSKKDRPKSEATSYNFISRQTLSRQGFQLISFCGEVLRTTDISVSNLINAQKSLGCSILDYVITELERRIMMEKEKYRMKKLASLFPNSLGYHFSKVYEGINSNTRLSYS